MVFEYCYIIPFPLIDNDYNFVLPLKCAMAKMINTKKLKHSNDDDDDDEKHIAEDYVILMLMMKNPNRRKT